MCSLSGDAEIESWRIIYSTHIRAYSKISPSNAHVKHLIILESIPPAEFMKFSLEDFLKVQKLESKI